MRRDDGAGTIGLVADSTDLDHDVSSNGAAEPAAEVDAPPQYSASILPEGECLPQGLAEAVLQLEEILGMPVWLLVLKNRPLLDEVIVESFLERRSELPAGRPIALLIDSPGGQARAAYALANAIRGR